MVPWWIRIVRWFLGATFIVYGTVKLAGGQFYHGDFDIDSKKNADIFMVWAFFGYSWLLTIYVGLGETIAGILLFFRRTATLGAMMAFGIASTITVIDFSFGFPGVKYFACGLTVLAAILLWHDRHKLKRAFWDLEPPSSYGSKHSP
jgi:uncharacterized membrane protein YphA (DoxX/SURF4 family)